MGDPERPHPSKSQCFFGFYSLQGDLLHRGYKLRAMNCKGVHAFNMCYLTVTKIMVTRLHCEHQLTYHHDCIAN